MSATRTVFYGFGCFVGQTVTVTQCGWWAQDPTTLTPPYDTSKLITTDIGKNPEAHRGGSITIAQIEADDAPAHGGLTKVGPSFPAGSMVNGLWIEEQLYKGLPSAIKPPRLAAGMQCRDYELCTVVYWSGGLAPRRFWGLYAEIISETSSQAQCKLWAPGTSLVQGQPPATTVWIDLATQAHPIEPGFTEIGMARQPKQGALFVDSVLMSGLKMNAPKLPPVQGAAFYPHVRR